MGFEIIWQSPNGLIKRHFGHVTGSEIFAAVVRIEADSRFDTLRYVINDFSECTSISVAPGEIEEIAAIDHAASMSNPNIRIAIIATQPEVIAQGKAYANDPLTNYKTRVFSSIDEAEPWLKEGLA